MNAFLLLPALLLGAGDQPDGAATAFEFVDADSFDGRAVVQYRAIEFRDKPARPLRGKFKPEPGARWAAARWPAAGNGAGDRLVPQGPRRTFPLA